jgi:hypothetical protein
MESRKQEIINLTKITVPGHDRARPMDGNLQFFLMPTNRL